MGSRAVTGPVKVSRLNWTLDVILYALLGAMATILTIALIVYLVRSGPMAESSSSVVKTEKTSLAFRWVK